MGKVVCASMHRLFLGAAASVPAFNLAQCQPSPKRILVVGSVNVDLIKDVGPGNLTLGSTALDISAVKGQTLPSDSFLNAAPIASQLAQPASAGEEEAMVLTMQGPFTQVTGGKGANAAAAVGQTCGGGACISEFIGQFGAVSSIENIQLLKDLHRCSVNVDRSPTVPGPTGTAFILKYDDNDNAIVLIGGANQAWPTLEALAAQDATLRSAVSSSSAVMLQREVPGYLNVLVARLATEAGIPVMMDVGGHDRPLDPELMPYISIIAPNESELTWISGVETTEDGELVMAKVREAALALKQKFAAASNPDVEVLVTLGRHGSIYFDKSEAATSQAKFNTGAAGALDTTGAGDCFRGSFMAARFGLGMSVSQAMQWASAAGSLAVEVPGAMPSMPSRVQIATRVDAQCKSSMVFKMSWQK